MLPEDLSVVAELFDALAPHSARWQTLAIDTESLCQRRLVRRFLEPLAVPNLTTFSFETDTFSDIYDHHEEWEREILEIFTGGAPLLDALLITGCHWIHMCPPVRLLTHFDSSRASITAALVHVRDFELLLKEATSLEYLDISGEADVDVDGFSNSISAPNLTTLILSEEPTILIKYLEAPRLRTLELRHFFLPTLLESLASGPRPSSAEVLTLTLQPREWTTDSGPVLPLHELVDRMPKVRHLRLDNYGKPSDNGSMLRAAREGWPALQTLTTKGMDKANLQDWATSRAGSSFAEFHFSRKFAKNMRVDYPEILGFVQSCGIEVKETSLYKDDMSDTSDDGWTHRWGNPEWQATLGESARQPSYPEGMAFLPERQGVDGNGRTDHTPL